MSSLVKVAEQAVAYDLVKIENGLPMAVTSYLDEYIKALNEHQEDSVKNDIDADVVVEKIKEAKDTFKGVKTYRLGFTNPFKSVTSEFTDREKNILSIIAGWEQHLDKMKEETFKIAEATIRVELNKLLDENQDLGLTIAPFESFIQVQRKVKGMLPSEKTGKLSKASLKKIDEAFEEIAEPIRKAKALEELKAKEQQTFDEYLPNATFNSIEEGKALLITLAQQKESIDRLYPNVAQHSHGTLDNRVQQVESNIRGLEAIKAKEEAEAKAKAEREVDLPLLREAELIASKIENNAHDKQWLDTQLQSINGLSDRLSFKENAKTLTGIKERLFAKLSLLELVVEQGEVQEDLATPFDSNTVVIEEPINNWSFNFQMTTIPAVTEAEAKAKARLIKEYALSIGVEFKSI